MLQTLRDKTSGWIATVILGLLIVPFAFFGLEQYMVQGSNNTVAVIKAPPAWWSSAPSFWPASVFWRHEEITVDEFRGSFEQVRQQQRSEQGESFDPRAFEQADNKRAVLEMLIDQRVQAMSAERAGIVVSDAMVRETIQAIPAFQIDGKFDAQRYQLALASRVPAQTPAQFDQAVRDSLQQSLVASAVARSSFVTPGELDRLVRLMGERRDVTVVVVPPPAVDTAAVTDAEIQGWYDAHQADFRAPESVSLEYIELATATMPALPAPDEAVLRERYAQESSRFAEQEQRLASHILIEVDESADAATQRAAEVKAADVAAKAKAVGADFAALAAENSDDTGSSASGGDLGWIARDTMPAPVEDALFAMQAGQVSDPVKSEFGWHVLQLREIKAGAQEPFEQARAALAAEQAEADREKAFNELSSVVVDAVLQNPGELAPAAEAAKLQVQTLGPITRDSAVGIAANPAVKRAAFSEVLIQDGTVSDPISVAPGHNVWIRVVEHRPEAARPLEQVRDQVVAAIRDDRERKAARERADALLVRLQDGQSLAELAAAESLPEPQVLTEVPRGAPLLAAGVNEALFAQQVPPDTKSVPGRHVLEDGAIVLFTVDKVTPGDASQLSPQQVVMLQQQLAQVGGIDDVRALTAALRKNMKIIVAEENL